MAVGATGVMRYMMQQASRDASLLESIMVKAITLRNLPPELADKVEEEARRTGASLNATVIALLRRALMPETGTSCEPKRFHDLDFLAGTWTKEEADEFDRYLEESRRIDMELTRLEWEREDKEREKNEDAA
jgi:plasmid stability protein